MQILLATHGKMASGMRSSVEILFGQVSNNFVVFDAYIGDEKLEDFVEQFLANTAAEETKLLVSDVYGGSVCQQLTKYIHSENTYVITGVNLGMLFMFLLEPDEPTKERLNAIIQESKELMCIIDDTELDKQLSNNDIFD